MLKGLEVYTNEKYFEDERGFFMESWNYNSFTQVNKDRYAKRLLPKPMEIK